MPRRPCIGLPSFVSIDLCMALATLTYGHACDICGRDSAVLSGNSSDHVRTIRWCCNTSESRVTTYIGPLTSCSSLIQPVNVPDPDRTYAIFWSGPKESRTAKFRVSMNVHERGCGTTSLAALQCLRQPCTPKKPRAFSSLDTGRQGIAACICVLPGLCLRPFIYGLSANYSIKVSTETWWVWERRTCITSSATMVRRSEVRPVWFVLIVVVFSLMRVGIRLNGWADEIVISNTWWRAWSERRKIGIGRYH